MLVVGYPVSYETACEMFNVEQDSYGRILDAAVEKTGLKFHWVDKGVNIIGLEIKEIGSLWDTYTSVDESIGIIMKYKLKFAELVEEAELDISEVVIERMEMDPIVVKNPPPYLITI
jgi:hypothetical protein